MPGSASRGGARQRALAAAGIGLSARGRSRSRSRATREQEEASGSTRSRVAPNDDGASQFRSHIARLYLKNTFSAHQVQQLLEKSEAAHAQGVADIASAGKRASIPKNTSRDLMRKLLKSVTAPPVYWADVPLHDPKGSTTTCRLPVLLPHEMFASIMVRDSNLSRFEDQRLQHLLQLCTDFYNAMRLTDREVAIIGVHGDGVPHQRGKSVECFSWNFAGLPGSERVLAAVIEKEHCCKCGCSGRHTTDEVKNHQASTVGKMRPHCFESARKE